MLAAPITLPTLFYFAGDALAKAGGRADQRRAAHVGKPAPLSWDPRWRR